MTPAAEFEATLQQTRARMHRGAPPTSLAGSAGLGGVTVLLLWDHAPAAHLWAWMGVLAVVVVVRALMGLAHRRDPQADAQAQAWVRRHRIAAFVHGLAWAGAGFVLGGELTGEPFKMMVVAFAALVAGATVATAFDLVAAMLFTAPPVAMLSLTLAMRDEPGSLPLVLIVALFIVVTISAARRTQRGLQDSVTLLMAQSERQREARHASERADRAHQQLADQLHLMTQLLQTTHQGFWFLDNVGITTQLNPAMALMLGRRAEDVIGRSVFDFFGGADLERLRIGFEQRRQGRPGSYEVALVRPDGTRLHCLIHATPLYDTHGVRVGSVAVYTDITVRREAEDTLRTYQLAVNSITDLVSVTDEREIYRLVNDAWVRASGVSRERALGHHPSEVFPGAVSPERSLALHRAIATGQPQTARGPMQRPTLTDRLLETSYFPYHVADGQLRYVAMVTRDITEQEHTLQRLRALQAEQQALLEAFPGFMGRFDAHGNYTFANQKLARLLGTTPEEMVSRPAAELLGEARAKAIQQLVARVLAGETVVYEAANPTDDARHAGYSEITLAPGTDPRTGEPAVFGFGIDISARKRAEEALIAARDEAQSANRAKTQFLAQMSHELRTPLNAILGFGQLLQADPEHPLPPRQHEHVHEILRGARHLLALINQMLDLGRIEAGHMVFDSQAVPLEPLVDECLALVRPQAQDRAVRLLPPQHAAGAPAVQADAVRLKQVLLNLLANAIKYNRHGGEVQLCCQRDGDAMVRIEVRDTGRGLAPAEVARLFQPFERLGAAASGIEGTGIGLALSRRLVEAMGGEVGVDSRPGEGSRFWLHLPLAEPSASPAAPVAALEDDTPPPTTLSPPEPHPAQTVLYIEDNPVNIVLMEAMLEHLPERVRLLSAVHPQEGLQLAFQEQPDLVLLDLQLPGMHGLQVLQHLRAHPATQHVPVVAVSANAVAADVEAALAAGMDAYLTKPLEMHTLMATVKRLLATHRVARDAAG